ncbi:MauE/DoxX family redox-associated membrane protein [Melioribacter sp. OK-6-Me]|uniref:MauE/DoxX family redox-associated membrane protein n=1 Tax=unclassified Melioribacter TaxID=2627329 RepID=UPI003EDAEF43
MNNKLTVTLKFILGALFIFSAYSKAISPGLIEIILIDHGITGSREVAALLTRLLIGFELGLGILFFLPYETRRFTLPLSTFVLIIFTLYLLYTEFILGDSQNCGCFGSILDMSPIESSLKNIVLLLLITIVYKSEKISKKNLFIPAATIFLSIVITFTTFPIKAAENFPFSKFTHFEGAGRVDLSSGEKFIAVFNTECEHCQSVAEMLAKYDKNHKLFSKIFTLYYTEGEVSVDSFKTLTGFDYPYTKIEVDDFFDLIGTSPPRVYFLNNGEVKNIWDDNFEEIIEFLKKR